MHWGGALHSETTLGVAERVGWLGIGALLLVGTVLGAGIVSEQTTVGVDLLLAGASAAAIGAATWVGGTLRTVASLPLQIAPVVSRGVSGGQPVYRFRAQLGRGRTLRDPVATVSWLPDGGDEQALEPWIPADSLCGPFTFLARDPRRVVTGEGQFVVRLQVRADGDAWVAEQRIDSQAVTEGPFEGVTVGRRGVRFTGAWQQVSAPLESSPGDRAE